MGITVGIRIDEGIAYDVLVRYCEDRKRLQIMNEKLDGIETTKKMACLAFWIRKLKPLYYVNEADPRIGNYLNEFFGIQLAIISCETEFARGIVLNEKYFYDLLYQFRYKSVSPHSLNIILKAMFTKF